MYSSQRRQELGMRLLRTEPVAQHRAGIAVILLSAAVDHHAVDLHAQRLDMAEQHTNHI